MAQVIKLDQYYIELMIKNIIMFVPMGVFLAVKYPIVINKISDIFISLVSISFVLEVLQMVLRYGVFEVDDIILNTFGGLIGYMIVILRKKRKKHVGD